MHTHFWGYRKVRQYDYVLTEYYIFIFAHEYCIKYARLKYIEQILKFNTSTYKTLGMSQLLILFTMGFINTILGVLIVPKYGILFYHWSVYIPRWDISTRTLMNWHSWLNHFQEHISSSPSHSTSSNFIDFSISCF